MIVLDIRTDNFYSFKDFHMNMSYPKKIVNSYISDEYLMERPNFRYKKINILLGANASGKTSVGKMLMDIFNFIDKKRNYYVYRYEGNLNGIENAVVLLSYPEKAFGNPKALRAFISTNAALSTQEILSWYVCRWPIEVFFRQCKDKLALDSYQIRSAQGIKRYWLLMSLAHFMCAVGTGRFCSFETGYHEICDTIQLEKYRYLFQCAKESNDFDSFMKFAV